MNHKLIFLTVPGLRKSDLAQMPKTRDHFSKGKSCHLHHSFPSVTWPAQATMLTGKRPDQHGVIANGFYWRETKKVEMWTAWNKVIEQPQIWDRLHQFNPPRTSAAWFPMLSKGCGADYVSMPAPIHKPDGTEELWCYTKPQEFYGELLRQFGHFPLQHFWGPIANIKSSQWIAKTAAMAAGKFRPDFFYIYLPHLDYAAQKAGPDSPAAMNALQELDQVIGELIVEMKQAFAPTEVKWVIATEYVIVPVDHVVFPNRVLRSAGLLETKNDEAGQELIDFENSKAWSLVDHQFSHVFVKNADPSLIARVVALFRGMDGIADVCAGNDRDKLAMHHERSGEVIVISEPNSWQAYYWWMDDSKAPAFARTVDIHRKPGYDPVELFFDMATKSIPLNASLVRGSHGVVTEQTVRQTVFSTLNCTADLPEVLADIDVCDWVLSELQ